MTEKNPKTRNILVLVGSTLLGAVGQLLFKYSFFGISAAHFYLFLALGLLAYIVSTVLYFYVLSRVHLVWAYGIGGLSYIFTIIFANFIENVPMLRWIGVVAIAAGVFLIGLS